MLGWRRALRLCVRLRQLRQAKRRNRFPWESLFPLFDLVMQLGEIRLGLVQGTASLVLVLATCDSHQGPRDAVKALFHLPQQIIPGLDLVGQPQ